MLIRVADWSRAPGPRYKREGKNSGEEYREYLIPILVYCIADGETLDIDLDGTFGYGCSFLEEAFAHFRDYYTDGTITFISEDEPELITEIEEYMYGGPRKRGEAT